MSVKHRLTREEASENFVHDLATPLQTAKLQTELLCEYQSIIEAALTLPESDNIPAHIKNALRKAPKAINESLANTQSIIQKFKHEQLNGSSSSSETTNKEQVNSTRSFRILLVDDETIHHDIANAALGANHSIEHAYSGEEAIGKCKLNQFDVILMDMQMPALSGKQTVLRINEIASSHQTLVIGLSNMPIQTRKQELLACGFNGFLDKPLHMEDFNTLVNALLNARR
ncbi:MAG: response regulator [Agarilytica sp.]